MEITREQIRSMLTAHGGSIHGPKVETVSIPEENFYLMVEKIVKDQEKKREAWIADVMALRQDLSYIQYLIIDPIPGSTEARILQITKQALGDK